MLQVRDRRMMGACEQAQSGDRSRHREPAGEDPIEEREEFERDQESIGLRLQAIASQPMSFVEHLPSCAAPLTGCLD